MRNIRISWRMMAIAAAAMIGLLLLCGTFLGTIRATLLDDRHDKVRGLVDTAYGVLAHYAELEKSGSLSRRDAQEAARAALRTLRYDDGEYFWINDFSPRMIMHPYKPELDGKDLTEFNDKKGKRLFVEMARIVEKNGAGFVGYYWPKPGEDKPLEKISYVKGFAPWGWIVGTGIYIDDVTGALYETTKRAAYVVLPLLVVLSALCFGIAHGIVKPLNMITKVMVAIARGDNSVDVAGIDRRDEVGDMARAVEVFKANAVEKLRLETEREENERRAPPNRSGR